MSNRSLFAPGTWQSASALLPAELFFAWILWLCASQTVLNLLSGCSRLKLRTCCSLNCVTTPACAVLTLSSARPRVSMRPDESFPPSSYANVLPDICAMNNPRSVSALQLSLRLTLLFAGCYLRLQVRRWMSRDHPPSTRLRSCPRSLTTSSADDHFAITICFIDSCRALNV